jgi:hypothetical protein
MFKVGDKVRLNGAYRRYACRVINGRRLTNDRPERFCREHRSSFWFGNFPYVLRSVGSITRLISVDNGYTYYCPDSPRVRIAFSENETNFVYDTFDLELANE